MIDRAQPAQPQQLGQPVGIDLITLVALAGHPSPIADHHSIGERRQGNLVRVNGTKTENAERVVPLLYPVTKPSLTYRQFNRRLEKLNLPVRARTGRKCFARWMNEAGIPRTRRRAYLGHATREDVTDRYEGYSPEAYLEEDRQRLRDFIGATPSLGLARVG